MVERLVEAFRVIGEKMTVKLHFLASHLDLLVLLWYGIIHLTATDYEPYGVE